MDRLGATILDEPGLLLAIALITASTCPVLGLHVFCTVVRPRLLATNFSLFTIFLTPIVGWLTSEDGPMAMVSWSSGEGRHGAGSLDDKPVEVQKT